MAFVVDGYIIYTIFAPKKWPGQKNKAMMLENKCASINRAEAPPAESMLVEEIRQAKQFLLHP